ncbi:peptidase S8/S53 domain-containing protein [Mucidula mucida]|nr:peptidase S8/S53 domain-containing protein [Mucidula mucida]
MLWSQLLALCAVALASASPLAERYTTLRKRHSWDAPPRGWEFHSIPNAGEVIELRIGLRQGRVDELISSLYEVSEPGHQRYGKHLSKAQVDALAAPHADSVAAVEAWLAHHGVASESVALREAWMVARVTVAQAESMLDTTYAVFHHSESASSVLRTMRYSLPAELDAHIDVMAPTTHFGTVRSMKKEKFEAVGELGSVVDIGKLNCETNVTVSCLRDLYRTKDYVPAAADNVLGVVGYVDEWANYVDLEDFLSVFRPDEAQSSFETVLVHGGVNDQSKPGDEANLDIQYTIGISAPTKNVYYSTGGLASEYKPDSLSPTNTNEPYLDWLEFILAQDEIPQTITTSYGDHEQTVPYDYAVRVCTEFAKLGARGSTVLFASGDFGVGGTNATNCLANDGSNEIVFQPMFPASCPYVTTVGGTTGVVERAASFSGGGFSNYFPAPEYQAQITADYVSTLGDMYKGLYNASGRGFPDIAAQAENFLIVLNETVGSIDGTSASSPTAAGVISLVNDYLLSTNRAPLGFLNPLIYKNAWAFNDITNGTNPGCGTDGFSAMAGWDPVTGLGTPDFKRLQALVDKVY